MPGETTPWNLKLNFPPDILCSILRSRQVAKVAGKMANHARIEELSDCDPEEMDISSFEPLSNSLIEPADIPFQTPAFQAPALTSYNGSAQDRERTKHWQCLYPVYFDVARTRDEGRRVGRELAVSNPLAREIVDAVQTLGLNVVFEPAKTHPKDWANPGRVRILLKENGKKVTRGINNSECSQMLHLPIA